MTEWKIKLSATDASGDANKASEMIRDGVPFIVFDTETTGLKPVTDRVLSFSAIKYVRWAETDRIDLFINPGFHIPEAASNVNHITDERVKNCPCESEAYGIIREFLGDSPFLGGYNSKRFDQAFMENMYLRCAREEFAPSFHVDGLEMARSQLMLKKYTLENVSRSLGLDAGIGFHNSIDDVIATSKVIRYLMDEYALDGMSPDKSLPKVNYWKNPARGRGIRQMAMSHKVNYLYVDTYPFTTTIYDIYLKEWRSDTEIDLRALRAQVLAKEGVKNEKELVSLFSRKAVS